MIPKIIHYCWFGGNPLPPKDKKCISSWKKYFPDHKIAECNESNYDVNKIPYTADAYKSKKYAFVSDYARYDLLYQYGGVYFDTDVEVIKPFDSILSNGPFMGMERSGSIAPGLGCAFYPEQPVLKEILMIYRDLDFFDSTKNNYIITDLTTDVFTKHGFKNNNLIQKVADTTIYPVEYFNPIDYDTHYLYKTCNTLSIHYGNASWVDGKRRLTAVVHWWLCRVFGKKTGTFLSGKFRKAIKSVYHFFFLS